MVTMFIKTKDGTLVNLNQINQVKVEMRYKEYVVAAYGTPTSNEDYCVYISLFSGTEADCLRYLERLCSATKAIDTTGYEHPSTVLR
jgi:hypothetical protein